MLLFVISYDFLSYYSLVLFIYSEAVVTYINHRKFFYEQKFELDDQLCFYEKMNSLFLNESIIFSINTFTNKSFSFKNLTKYFCALLICHRNCGFCRLTSSVNFPKQTLEFKGPKLII